MAEKRRTRENPSAPGGDARIEEYLDQRGVQWTFVPKVPTSEFDIERSLNNNARFVAIDKGRVEVYAEAMRRGDHFPPVIAHRQSGKYMTADGNHRLVGADQAHKPLDVYDITGADAEVLVLISFEANTKHGLPTTENERIYQALYLVNNGLPIRDAAAAVNLPKRIVEAASKKARTDQRFIDNNIPRHIVEKLGNSVKWRLSDISTDEGFRAAVDLAFRAGFGTDEAFRVTTELNELRSSDKQVARVRDFEEEYADQIRSSAGGMLVKGPRPGPGPRARVGVAVSNLLNLPDDLEAVTKSYVGPERAEQAQRMRAAADRLIKVADALAS